MLLADVYLDDFYGADSPARASTAFTALKQLLQELGLQISPEKNSLRTSLLRAGTFARTVSLVQTYVLHKEAATVITGKTFIRHCLH